MTELPGTPSDNVTAVLETGNGGIGTLFVSMATRHPGGSDADYLRWHTLDHRPEQHRLAALRASLRLVSTPACRSVRAVSHERFDPVDHVMTYFFTDPNGLTSFLELGKALRDAGRIPTLLPPVDRGAYEVRSKASAPHVKVGADVLPWWPVQGVFLLVEKGTAPATGLLDVDGVAGFWSASAATSHQGNPSPTAFLTTIRSTPQYGCSRCWHDDGGKHRWSRCWPRRFTRSCRTNGSAISRSANDESAQPDRRSPGPRPRAAS